MFKAMKKEVKSRNGKAKKVMLENTIAWLRLRHALEEIEKMLDEMPSNNKKDKPDNDEDIYE